MSEVEYTQRAVRAFNDPSAVRSPARDIRGRAVVRVVSNEGIGLFTKTGSNHMVSPNLINEIRALYEALTEQSLDIHEYSGRMFDVVFDIITADTYVAGVASKIMNGDTVSPEERTFIGRPMLMESRWWRCNDGQLFDLQQYARVKSVAGTVESLRHKCNALTSTLPRI